MPSFNKPDPQTSSPIGKNQYLRSVVGCKFESYTCSAASVAEEDFKNGVGDIEKIKYLQSGEILAKITSGPEAGKVGPFQLGVSDGRQTPANGVGVNDSYIPWQLNERDVDIAAMYDGTAVFGWCTIRDANGKRIPLTTEVANALRGTIGLDVTFK